MLEFAGLVLLVVLVLVGTLLPLKYTARMHLPKPRKPTPPAEAGDSSGHGGGDA